MARFSHGSLGAHGLGAPCAECDASSTLTTGSWGSPNSWGGLGDTSMVPPRLIQQWVSQDVARPHAHGAPWLQRDQGTARNLASEPGEGRERELGSPIPWEEGPAAAGAHELSQRGGNAAPAAPAGRLTALGSNTGNTLGMGSRHPTPAWEAPGAKGSRDPREIPKQRGAAPARSRLLRMAMP